MGVLLNAYQSVVGRADRSRLSSVWRSTCSVLVGMLLLGPGNGYGSTAANEVPSAGQIHELMMDCGAGKKFSEKKSSQENFFVSLANRKLLKIILQHAGLEGANLSSKPLVRHPLRFNDFIILRYDQSMSLN